MVAEPLSPEAFAPFGDVIRRPEAPAEPAFDWAEYHARSAELIVPPGEGVILAPGVGRGATLAVDSPLTAAVLLLEGTDTVVTRFTPIPLEV
jgi:hypothetical protein